MVQEIITYIIVAWAVFYTLKGAVGLFKKSAKPGCAGGGCSGCSAKTDLFGSIKDGKKPFLIYKGD